VSGWLGGWVSEQDEWVFGASAGRVASSVASTWSLWAKQELGEWVIRE
jgi:hypothetical protein